MIVSLLMTLALVKSSWSPSFLCKKSYSTLSGNDLWSFLFGTNIRYVLTFKRFLRHFHYSFLKVKSLVRMFEEIDIITVYWENLNECQEYTPFVKFSFNSCSRFMWVTVIWQESIVFRFKFFTFSPSSFPNLSFLCQGLENHYLSGWNKIHLTLILNDKNWQLLPFKSTCT